MKTIMKGDVGKAMIVADCLRRGFQVLLPLSEGSRYDIVIDRGGRLERIQCKYVESDGRAIHVKCRSTSSWSGKTRSSYRYTTKDVEWIGVYDKTTDRCYYVPSDILDEGRTEVSLRLVPCRQQQGVRMADKFCDL